MGWGESRISLLSPRSRSVENNRLAQKDGSVVRVIGVEFDSTATTAPVAPSAVRDWLLGQGFIPAEPPWLDGVRRQDVLAEFFNTDGELSELVLTFGLSRASPEHWPDWQKIVDALCARFGLLLSDFDAGTRTPSTELFGILSRGPWWPEFRDRFNWPAPPKSKAPRSAQVLPLGGEAPMARPHEQFKP